MTTPASGEGVVMTLADQMRKHAGDSAHLYGELMRSMADDWDCGGPVRHICAGSEGAPESAVIQLRLLAGLFRIVLTDRAPQLVQYYPSLGGQAPATEAWPVVREVLVDHVEELNAALSTAPQTNEVGRSTGLLVGLFEVVRRTGRSRLRLLEPGASAGLNLLVDRVRFMENAWSFGPPDSPLVLANGVVGDIQPQDFTVVERRGCDLSPVDAATPQGQLWLRSFVWPFHVERHERLSAALSLAERFPVEVDRASAGAWLERQLAGSSPADTVTVVWQSVTRLYWPTEEVERVLSCIDDARSRHAVAHVAMEFPDRDVHAGAELTLDGVPGTNDPLRLASVGDHGTPVTLDHMQVTATRSGWGA